MYGRPYLQKSTSLYIHKIRFDRVCATSSENISERVRAHFKQHKSNGIMILSSVVFLFVFFLIVRNRPCWINESEYLILPVNFRKRCSVSHIWMSLCFHPRSFRTDEQFDQFRILLRKLVTFGTINLHVCCFHQNIRCTHHSQDLINFSTFEKEQKYKFKKWLNSNISSL